MERDPPFCQPPAPLSKRGNSFPTEDSEQKRATVFFSFLTITTQYQNKQTLTRTQTHTCKHKVLLSVSITHKAFGHSLEL